ncbi:MULTISPECIES: WD40/YVTN/BNR-like repeat-containing protein [Marinobacter]|uniref:WD40/YVTN/BNR-like repeat-containing protein n=1 Tax=Marinobacter TaxID=2742 RepID=UPI0012455EA8|nr:MULTISPECIES: YCF48-related protein [Marinobacter]MBL3556351.1 hypothetical protein [Marinobacter sp. JB05H06]
MRKFKPDVLGANVVCLAMLIAPLYVQSLSAREVLPELTELPAPIMVNANHTVQLAVTNAGNRLISVGEQGVVLLSDDQGQSWRQSPGVPVSVTLTDVEFVSESEGWAVGHSGVILKTEDGGEDWVRVMAGEDIVETINDAVRTLSDSYPNADIIRRNASFLTGDEPILDIHFSEDGEGWLMGAYGIALRSSDGGKSWESAFSHTANPEAYHLYQYIPSTDTGGLIVGERGLVSAEQGNTGRYRSVEMPYQGTFFGGMALSADQYLLYGLRGNVWEGREGDWTALDTGSNASFSASVSTPRGIVLGDVSGRLFVKSGVNGDIKELTQASEAAITDLLVNSNGQLVVATARGLKIVDLDDAEFK